MIVCIGTVCNIHVVISHSPSMTNKSSKGNFVDMAGSSIILFPFVLVDTAGTPV